MAGVEDFFGVGMLGADPYHQVKANKLARFQQMDQILQSQLTAAGGGGGGEAPQTNRDPSAPFGPMTMGGGAGSFSYLPDPSNSNRMGWAGLPTPINFDGPGKLPAIGGSPQMGSALMPATGPTGPMNQMKSAGGSATPDALGAMARMMMRRGRGGSYSPQSRSGITSGVDFARAAGPTSNFTPPEGTPDGQFCPNGQHFNGVTCVPDGSDGGDTGGGGGGGGNFPTPTLPPNNGAGGGFGPYQDGTIPSDLRDLRNALGPWLARNFNQYNPAFGGQLSVGQSPWMGQAADAAWMGADDASSWLRQGGGTLQDLLGFNTGADMSSLMGPLQQILAGGGGMQGLINQGQNQTNQYGAAASGAADQMTQFLQRASGSGQYAFDRSNPYFEHAGNIVNDARGAIAGGQGTNLQGQSYLNNAQGSIDELMTTGGAPNIQSALDAIKNQGMGTLEDSLAQIREKFGSMGLGSSSDVAGELGRGASRGIADIISQQSQLAASVGNAAQDRRLATIPQAVNAGQFAQSPYESMMQRMLQSGGLLTNAASQTTNNASSWAGAGANLANANTNVAGGFANQSGAYSNIGDMLSRFMTGAGSLQGQGLDTILRGIQTGQGLLNNPAQMALASAGVRGNAAGMLPQYAGAAGTSGANLASLLASLSGQDMQRQGNNINSIYQDWVRSTTNPYLGTAAGYATGFPPSQPTVSGNGSIWGSLGSAAISALPFFFM